MFFKQVWRNSAKNRKGNGLFFGSLVIAIIAFYTLLSLGEQDVMRYLSKVESDAVGKLMMLLPVVYMVSLFFVFFLVYFACRYQADSRRREFGMYLMLGMKRSRMFFMQFCETLWNSMISLLIGIPVALFLTEAISLATAKDCRARDHRASFFILCSCRPLDGLRICHRADAFDADNLHTAWKNGTGRFPSVRCGKKAGADVNGEKYSVFCGRYHFTACGLLSGNIPDADTGACRCGCGFWLRNFRNIFLLSGLGRFSWQTDSEEKPKRCGTGNFYGKAGAGECDLTA